MMNIIRFMNAQFQMPSSAASSTRPSPPSPHIATDQQTHGGPLLPSPNATLDNNPSQTITHSPRLGEASQGWQLPC